MDGRTAMRAARREPDERSRNFTGMPALAQAEGNGHRRRFSWTRRNSRSSAPLWDSATKPRPPPRSSPPRRLREGSAPANQPALASAVPRADFDLAISRAETAEAALAQRQKDDREAEITSAVDEAIEAGKVAPSSRDYHIAACNAEGGLAEFRKFVAAAPAITDPVAHGVKPGRRHRLRRGADRRGPAHRRPHGAVGGAARLRGEGCLMALSAARQTPRSDKTVFPALVKAGAAIHEGAMLVWDGGYVKPAAKAANQVFAGRAEQSIPSVDQER